MNPEKRDEQETRESEELSEAQKKAKKPYSPPRLTDYGQIRSLTLQLSGQGHSEAPD